MPDEHDVATSERRRILVPIGIIALCPLALSASLIAISGCDACRSASHPFTSTALHWAQASLGWLSSFHEIDRRSMVGVFDYHAALAKISIGLFVISLIASNAIAALVVVWHVAINRPRPRPEPWPGGERWRSNLSILLRCALIFCAAQPFFVFTDLLIRKRSWSLLASDGQLALRLSLFDFCLTLLGPLCLAAWALFRRFPGGPISKS